VIPWAPLSCRRYFFMDEQNPLLKFQTQPAHSIVQCLIEGAGRGDRLPRTQGSVIEFGRWREGHFAGFPRPQVHHPNANKPPTQTTAITIRPLIMVNVSSLTLNIPHLIET
jgi:hypothetical protein